VRFNEYADIDVLEVVEVDRPIPGPGEVLVGVKAAGINPGEAMIRKGLVHDLWPATFPSGEGSDLAGVVEELGAGVAGFEVGDEVFGFTNNRASHADFVMVDADHLVHRPSNVSWEAAGVAGTAAFAAVRAAAVGAGDTAVVSEAAGGVGALTVQLATNAGATVVGLASEASHEWLAAHGVIPRQGRCLHRHLRRRLRHRSTGRARRLDRSRAPGGPDRQVYPREGLADVRDAYKALDQRHTRGKIVLVP
jgi:NADPH:quinone reductase-like Zn-dependent oxidoreductase